MTPSFLCTPIEHGWRAVGREGVKRKEEQGREGQRKGEEEGERKRGRNREERRREGESLGG